MVPHACVVAAYPVARPAVIALSLSAAVPPAPARIVSQRLAQFALTAAQQSVPHALAVLAVLALLILAVCSRSSFCQAWPLYFRSMKRLRAK